MTELFKKAKKYTEANMIKKAGLYPYFIPSYGIIGPRTMMDGKETIMLGSNNYMGLNNHPEMIKASCDATKKYGTGCTGSRFLNGTLDLHEKLELKLADFMGRDDVLTFTTGYQTNLGVISAISCKGDYIISDTFNHASIVDGCRQSRAKTVVFKHNDMEDLEKVISELPEKAGKLVVVDGVFSMEGNIARVPEILKIAHEHEARLMVDDAHGLGYLGDHGEGVGGYFHRMQDIDLITGTFSKSFAGVGGFVAGDDVIIDFIRHQARSFIFSASMPPACAASSLKATELIWKADDRRKQLLKNAKMFRDGLDAIGFETGVTETPIVPVIIKDEFLTFRFWRALLDAGVYTNPVRAPAVPPGRELLRTSLMATHTEKDIVDAIEIFETVGKEFKII
jgi:8-amino-7-oxononanoate synthase